MRYPLHLTHSSIAEAFGPLGYPFFEMFLHAFTKKESPDDSPPTSPRNASETAGGIVPFCDLAESERVVELYYKSLYVFALSLTKSEHDAWDLTHDTYARWARNHHRINDKSKTKSWLYSTLYRCFLDHYRKQKRTTVFPETELASDFEHPSARSLDHETVLKALQGLPEKFRAPLTLFYLEDCSYREIGRILSLRAGTVMSRLSRARSMLAGRLDKVEKEKL